MSSPEPRRYQPPQRIELAVCPVSYFGADTTLNLHATIQAERFLEDPAINPLGIADGIRTHVTGIFSVPLPVSPPEEQTEPEDPFFPNSTHSSHALGVAQGWYYPQQRSILLWSVILTQPNQPEEPTGHPAFTTAWHAFEQLLRNAFPDATSLITPASDPSYPPTTWHTFLTQQGYRPHPLLDSWYREI